MEEARSILNEFRRHNRSRIKAEFRPHLRDLPSTELVSDDPSTPQRPKTRARGPVPDLENVQSGTLEYRIRRQCKVAMSSDKL